MIAPGTATLLELAPASTPATAPPLAATNPLPTPAAVSGPAFETILLLHSAPAGFEAGVLEPLEIPDPVMAEDGADDEDSGEELEAALAFLSELLTATVPRSGTPDHGAGAQSQGQSGMPAGSGDGAERGAAAAVLATVPDPAPAETGESSSKDLIHKPAEPPPPATADARAAPPWLPTGNVPDRVDTGESREFRGTADATQALARAAELLGTVTRAAMPSPERHLVGTHVRDPRWAEDFSARVSLLARGAETRASLQLNPAELGPVEVNVTVKESQATVHFGASQAETRALIEASLPKLRELLAAQGYQLTDASVSSGFGRPPRQEAGAAPRESREAEVAAAEPAAVRSLSLLDLYV